MFASTDTATVPAWMLDRPEYKVMLLNLEAESKQARVWEDYFVVPCLGQSLPMVEILALHATCKSVSSSLFEHDEILRRQSLPFRMGAETKEIIEANLPNLKWKWETVAALIVEHS